MEKINFEAGTQISPAKVTIDDVEHNVTPAVWEGKTPLSPHTLNLMQDNIENEINTIKTNIETIHTYSTEEQVIGTWINGKPLYRKVVTNINVEASKTTGTYAYQYVKVGDDFEELFVKEVYFISNTSTTKQVLPVIYDSGNMIKVSIPDANNIMFSNNSTASGTATAIIEYTKTTD